MPDIRADVSRHKQLGEELLRRFAELADDPEAFQDTLEGVSPLPDRIAAVLRSALEDEATVAGLAEYMKKIQARKKRLEDRAGTKRALALWACQEGNVTKIPAPDLTATVSMGKGKVIITDEQALSSKWVRIKREPDKIKIGEALRAGTTVIGATLGNPVPILTVRTS